MFTVDVKQQINNNNKIHFVVKSRQFPMKLVELCDMHGFILKATYRYRWVNLSTTERNCLVECFSVAYLYNCNFICGFTLLHSDFAYHLSITVFALKRNLKRKVN